MAKTYLAGNETKRKIIETSSTLFYQKGFSKTTYDDISKSLGINRALIPYHFKSKQILGQTIYTDLIRQYIERLDSILDIEEFSKDFVSILHIVAYYRLLEDSAFTRFLYELQADECFSEHLEESERLLLSGLLEKASKLSDEEVRILIISEIGMKKELVRLIHASTDADIPKLAQMQLYMLLGYAGYSKKKVEELYDSATQVIDMLNFDITEQLQVNISFR